MNRTLAFGLTVMALLASPFVSSVAFAQNNRGQQQHHQVEQRQAQPTRVIPVNPQRGGDYRGQLPQGDHRQQQDGVRQVNPEFRHQQPQIDHRNDGRGNEQWRRDNGGQRGNDQWRRNNDHRNDGQRGNDQWRRDNDHRNDGRGNDQWRHDNDHRNDGRNWHREPQVGQGQYRNDRWLHRDNNPGIRFAPPAWTQRTYPYRGQYHGRWQGRGGFNFFGGFYIGGVFISGNYWARPDYCPTDWVFEVRYGRWYRPGVSGYVYNMPAYQGPITVAVEEEVYVGDDYYGNPEYELETMYYNAYYYPGYGRYGYVDIDGDFNWVY